MGIIIIIAIGISVILILLSYIISHSNIYPTTFSSVNESTESKSQYECGLEPFEEELGKETRERFYIKFYIIGILFLIFDLETLLIFPSSLIYTNPSFSSNLSLEIVDKSSNILGSDTYIYNSYILILIFLIILILGLTYEYRKNIL